MERELYDSKSVIITELESNPNLVETITKTSRLFKTRRNLANLIADKFGLPEVEKGKNRWNDATLHQTEARAKIEETLTIMLRTRLVKDWDHLKTLVDAL